MALWKITDNKPQKISETRFKHEKFLEENLEDWIEKDPSILGEPLLIIGRQVLIPDTRDSIDLLGVDPQGSMVIIELKRGHLKDPVDMQALRYASYVSKWKFEDFENHARNYYKKIDDPEFNFNDLFESFCKEAGVDEAPDLNGEQRMIVVGSTVRDKIGSVALWLREHSVDIKVIEVQAYKEGESILIEPNIIIPVQVSKGTDTGRIRGEGEPWMTDGRGWHLEKRCTPKTKELFLTLDKLLQEHLEVDGPQWRQKHYIAYRVNNYNWLSVITGPKTLRLDFLIKAKVFDSDQVATQLGIAKFEKEESLSEKLGLPSSVFIKNRTEVTDRMYIRVKEDFNLEAEAFLKFLEAAYKACPK